MWMEEYDGRETILLVEDDRSVRELVDIVLQKLGYRVLVASDGPRALDLWSRTSDQIDLLMTDLVMPGEVDGLALARQLCSEKCGLKAIVFSGYITDTVKSAAEASEDLAYLEKPFDQRQLARVVRDLLGVGRTT